jgi:putative DNA primase/helicase
MFNETPSDAGNARWFVRINRGTVQFVRESGVWLEHLGSHWSPSTDGSIERKAKAAAAAIFANLEELPKNMREDRIRHGLKTEQAPRLMAMLELAKSEPGITIPVSVLDRDPFLLGTRGGGIDLRTGSFKLPHASEYVTRQAGCEYRRHARCPTWIAFLDRVMDGDVGMIEFLQRAVGYSLTGDTSEQCIFICHGPGANGKSVFLRTVRALLGTYGADASIETFTDRRDGSASNDLARLANIRFVSATELDEGRWLAEGLIKSLTGGEAITARFLFREFFEFTPAFKVWLGVNHKPTIRGDDNGIWRRIRLVPFRVTIPTDQQDKALAAKLIRELPGILNWAVEGCLAWQRAGLQAPTAVVAATNAYRDESDALGEWIVERCDVCPGISTQAKFLYDDYRSFTEDRGGRALSMKRWGQRMVDKGFEKDEGRTVHYRGVGLCDINGRNGRNGREASFIGERDLRDLREGFPESFPYTRTRS